MAEQETARIVASPHWEWWVIFYFFLGGIAAGAYAIAALMDMLGGPEDRDLARIGYYIAFPLVAVCGVLLILDLTRPERFWHMIIQSETLRPMFKYWSPMSTGAWALLLFGGFTFASFVAALAADDRWGMGRLRGLTGWLHRGVLGKIYLALGTLVAFYIASYTGSLLTATNQPFWSDSPTIGALFLASAASSGIATMILLRRRTTAHAAVERLEFADTWALGLELAALAVFLISLGGLAADFLGSVYGIVLLVVAVGVGLLAPLALRLIPATRAAGWSTAVTAALVLVGCFALRYSVVMAGQHVAVYGR